MNELPGMGRERTLYLGVTIGGAVLSLAMLYALYHTVTEHASPMLILAVALVLAQGGLFAASGFRHYHAGRLANTARLDRVGRVLTWVVLLLIAQQLWTIRHRMDEVRAEAQRLQESTAPHR